MRDLLLAVGARAVFPLLLLGLERVAARAIAEEGVAGALLAGGQLDLAFALGLYLSLRLFVIAALSSLALATLFGLAWEGAERLRGLLRSRRRSSKGASASAGSDQGE